MAQTQVAAIEGRAVVEIEMSCLNAQTKLAVAGLASDAAKAFIDALPSVEELMKPLSFAEIAGEADPPITEQLVSPNALRQRRFRERQRIRSSIGTGEGVTPPDRYHNAAGGDSDPEAEDE